jgi:hypothetical protein
LIIPGQADLQRGALAHAMETLPPRPWPLVIRPAWKRESLTAL